MNRKVVSILLASTLMATNFSFTSPSLAFEDTENHWADSYIEGLKNEEIITGYDDGNFKPESHISREETAVIIDRAIRIRKAVITGKAKEVSLSDIYGRWSTESIESLVSKGIIEGYPDGTFKPENSITRQELTAIVYRIINPAAEGETEAAFSDIENQWGEDLIERLTELGVINGYPDGSFKPNEYIKRAEVAKIVYEVVNGSDINGESLLMTEDSQKDDKKPEDDKKPGDDKKPETDKKPGEDKPSSGGSGSSGGSYTKKSKETGIKIKEDSESAVNLGGTEDAPVIDVYKTMEDGDSYRPTTFQDVVDKIESADGSKQSYEVADGALSDSVDSDKELTVTAEDKRTKKNYKINVINREQKAPQGIGKVNEEPGSSGAKGKITNVNDKMQYKKDGDTDWTDVPEGDTEIANLPAGTYKVRLKGDPENGLNPGAETEVVIEKDKSTDTGIKVKEEAATDIVKSIDSEEGTITVNSSKVGESGFEKATFDDMIAELESTDGTNQTYTIKEGDSSDNIVSGRVLEVTAEDGTTKKEYNIVTANRDQAAPEGVTGVNEEPGPSGAKGKITGVNDTMEYQKEGDTDWTSVPEDATEVEVSEPGKYKVRYKENSELGLNAGTETEVEIKKDKSNVSEVQAVAGDKSTVISVDNAGKKITVYKSKPSATEASTYEDIVSELETADKSAPTYEVADGELTDAIDNGTLKVTSEDGTSTTDYTIEVVYRDQAAPEGVAGVNEEPGPSGAKGKITGVNDTMEYQKEGDTDWTSVPKDTTEVEVSEPGKYKVRYKENSELGLNAGTETEVEIKKDKSNVSEVQAVAGDKSTVISVDNAGKKITVYKSKPSATEASTYEDIVSELEAADKSAPTYEVADGELTDTIDNGTLKVTSEDGTSTTDYTIEVVYRDQAAPEGLEGTSATSATATDGTITGVTKKMEYRVKGEENFIPVVAENNITGLAAGTYEVRYAQDDILGLNASSVTEVTVDYVKSNDTAIEKVADSPVVKEITGNTIKVYKSKAGAEGYEATKVSDLEAGVTGNESQKSREVVTSGGEAVADEAALEAEHVLRVVAEDETSEDYIIEFVNRDQEAPEGVAGVNEEPGPSGAKGKITGVNDTMEYQKEGDTDWTSVPKDTTEVEVSEPGKYKVRYKENSELGLNAGTETEVEIKKDKSNVSEVQAVAGDKSTVISVDNAGKKITVYKSKPSATEASTYEDIVSELEAADKSAPTYGVADGELTDTIDNGKLKVTSEDGTSITDYAIEVVYRDQAAPEGVAGVNEESGPSGAKGKITGVNDTMEYQKEGDTDWTSVPEDATEVEVSEPGKYKVRYKENSELGLNAGTETEVEIKKDKSNVSEVQAVAGDKSTVISVDNAGKKITVYKSKPSATEASTYEDIVSELEAADKSAPTYEVADGELTDAIDNGTLKVTSEDGTSTTDYTIEVVYRDQAAPEGLEGNSATSATATDGTITGVTKKMEYRVKGEENFIPVVAENNITGLAAGTYEVRYAQDDILGLNASSVTEVTVDYVKSNDKAIEKVADSPVVKEITGNTIKVYKSKAGAEGYEATKVSDLEAGVTGNESQKSREVVASGGEAVADEAALEAEHVLRVVAEDETSKDYTIEFVNRDQAAPEGVAGGEGKITGLTDKMEYKKDTDEDIPENWKIATGTEVTGLTEGIYSVRYKADDNLGLNSGAVKEVKVTSALSNSTEIQKKADSEIVESVDTAEGSEKVSVKKSKFNTATKLYEQVTVADIKGGVENTAEAGLQEYKVLETGEGSEITEEGTAISSGNVLEVTAENGTSKKEYSIEFGTNIIPAAPEVSKTDTTDGEANGKLKGLNNQMEYKKSDDSDWTAAPNGDVENLAAGNYSVRYKADDNLGLDSGEEKTLEIKSSEAALSDSTEIQKKADSEIVESVDTAEGSEKVSVKKSKFNTATKLYEQVTVADIKGGVENTAEAGLQEYKVLETSKGSEITEEGTAISSGNVLEVTAENGTNKKEYSIEFGTNIIPAAPEVSKTDTTDGEANGKLKGLNNQMEYKKSDDSDWTAAPNGDVENLAAGNYSVRYKADDNLGLDSGEEKTLEIKGSEAALSNNTEIQKKADAVLVH